MAKTSLSPLQFKEMLLKVADAIIAAEPMLSEADRNLGDGDHGIGMTRGMNAVKEKLGALPEDATLDKLANTVGMAMMSSMGGASGVIFGSFFMGGSKSLAGKADFDASGLAGLLRGACDTVMTRGKAKPGDKTMVDALHPAAAKAEEVVSSSLPEAIDAVTAAAIGGREASKDMIAQFGRAKTLGEACLGFPDAGACSVVVMLETMQSYIAS
jgi:phosphoenolpyruvate---glycerone phosphotransferase subunit DhaL